LRGPERLREALRSQWFLEEELLGGVGKSIPTNTMRKTSYAWGEGRRGMKNILWEERYEKRLFLEKSGTGRSRGSRYHMRKGIDKK